MYLSGIPCVRVFCNIGTRTVSLLSSGLLEIFSSQYAIVYLLFTFYVIYSWLCSNRVVQTSFMMII